MSTSANRREVTARAPGKVVWLGEYAVLEGAPAVVCSVDRHAIATFRPASDAICRVVAPNLGGTGLAFEIAGEALIWHSRPAVLELAASVIDDVLTRVQHHRGEPFQGTLDSHEFFTPAGKLGLGSSAAVASALYRALLRWFGVEESGASGLDSQFVRLWRLHSQIQAGRGSGIDVAASVYGGLNRFVRGNDCEPAQIRSLKVPGDLSWCGVYAGHAVSTSGYLARLDTWQIQQPRAYARHMRALTALAEAGSDALEDGDTDKFIAAASTYQIELARLGEAAGIDIASREHRRLRRLAEDCDVAYKSSGAGGGDLGLAFSRRGQDIDAFAEVAVAAGFEIVSLRPAEGDDHDATL